MFDSFLLKLVSLEDIFLMIKSESRNTIFQSLAQSLRNIARIHHIGQAANLELALTALEGMRVKLIQETKLNH